MSVGPISGAGKVPESYEYTSPEVKEEYERLLKELQRLMDPKKGNLSNEDKVAFENALNASNKLSQDGIGGKYFTKNMWESFNLVMDGMKAAGVEPGKPFSVDDLNKLKTQIYSAPGQKEVTFETILSGALSMVSGEGMTFGANAQSNIPQRRSDIFFRKTRKIVQKHLKSTKRF